MQELPPVSCLCVTHHKPNMLRRVIHCFIHQRYLNKQLIIVYEKSDVLTCEFINRQHFESNIKTVKIDMATKPTLGELRNISIREADGCYVCQWDDDDWYDADRLTEQMNRLLLAGKSGSILSRWIIFDATTQKAYLPLPYLWEGSILCKREIILQTPYPSLSKGEDTSVIEFLNKNDELVVIDDMPHLYVYTVHGNNTWEYAHFTKIFVNSLELPADYTNDVIEVLSGFDVS